MESWPLSGREPELARCIQSLDAGRTLFVCGPTGIGKSRLVADALGNRTVRRVAASEPLKDVTCGVLASLTSNGSLEGLSHTAALVQLRRALSTQAATTAIVVENAQWLDPFSAAVLAATADEPGHSLVLTVRSIEDAPLPLRRLAIDDTSDVIDLRPLDRRSIAALLDRELGSIDSVSVARLRHATGGVPLLLRSLVGQALLQGQLREVGGRWSFSGHVEPDQVLLATVATITAGLDASTQRAFRLLALGEPLPSAVAGRALDADVLLELERRDLIVVRAGSVVVRHPLVGELLRAGLGDLERAELSTALASAAGGLPEPVLNARRILWALDGGAVIDPTEVRDAASSVLDVGDPTLASRLATATVLSSGSATVQRSAQLIAARARTALGEREQVIAAVDPLVHRGDLTPADLCEALSVLLRVADRSLVERLHPVVDRFLDGVQRDTGSLALDPAAVDGLRSTWAAALGFSGRWRAAAAVAAGLSDSPDPTARLRAVSPMTAGLLGEGRCQEAITLNRMAIDDALAHGTHSSEGFRWASIALFTSLLHGGHLHEVGRLLDASGPGTSFWLRLMRGRWLLSCGRADQALTEFTAALAHAEGDRQWHSWVAALRGGAAAMAGAVEVDVAAQVAMETGPAGIAANDFEVMVAWSMYGAGDLLGARRRLGVVAERVTREGHVSFECVTRYELLRLGVGGINALQLADVAARWDSQFGAPYGEHAFGRARSDPVLLERAASAFEAMGAMHFAADAWADAAATYGSIGRDAAQRRCANAAEALQRGCGGLTSPSLRGLSGAPSLTAREHDVAARAARGDSSRDIAAGIGLSVRTVDNLLGRVYMKLGISGRGELVDSFGIARSQNE